MTASARTATIMIPTYNQADRVGQAIESALAQDYPHLEVVVADDASTDATPSVVRAYCDDPRLRYVRNPRNLGRVGNYRSTLETHARGDFVLNLDGDDWLTEPSYIRRAMALVDSEPSLALVFGRAQVYAQEQRAFQGGGWIQRPLSEICDGTDLFLGYADASVTIPHMTALYRRDLALEVAFYHYDVLGADSLALLSLLPGRRVGFVDMPVGAWRVHGQNATSTVSVRAHLANLAVADVPAARAAAAGLVPPAVLRRWRTHTAARLAYTPVAESVAAGKPVLAAGFLVALAFRRPAVAIEVVERLARKAARKLGRRRAGATP